ncbi:phosphatidylinositol-glycan biosynthesis class X protein [Dendropsophus ebraccatus]|uniref:phosphatidylinositol-glycan biosynthesis class X protein n=1 Tax=Dendropsophus ebraccatus TaxID=150705 RepID=UPI003831464A
MSKSADALILNLIVTLSFCCGISRAAETFCPTLTVRREILKNGFHRDLVTKVEVHGYAKQTDSCRVLLQETIPAGLFLDPYQLSSLRQHNITEVLLLNPVDLEAPEYLSAESIVLVYTRPGQSCEDCFISSLPIHARYHRPSAQVTEVSIVLHKPQLLVHCSKDFLLRSCSDYPIVEAPCGPTDDVQCQWMDIPYTEVDEKLALQVPVGITHHGPAVCAITVAVTLFCTGLILTSVSKHRKVYR